MCSYVDNTRGVVDFQHIIYLFQWNEGRVKELDVNKITQPSKLNFPHFFFSILKASLSYWRSSSSFIIAVHLTLIHNIIITDNYYNASRKLWGGTWDNINTNIPLTILLQKVPTILISTKLNIWLHCIFLTR